MTLDGLHNPISFEVLIKETQCYAKGDVVQYRLEISNDLIITLFKQLVVEKTIKPVFIIPQ